MIALPFAWRVGLGLAVVATVAGTIAMLALRLDAAQARAETAELRESVLREAHAQALADLDTLEADRRRADAALTTLTAERRAAAERARRITREVSHATPADRPAAAGLRAVVDGL